MAVTGLIPGTKDYGISENRIVQSVLPWLKQINNPLVTKVQAAGPATPSTSGPISTTQYSSPIGPKAPNVLGTSTVRSVGSGVGNQAPQSVVPTGGSSQIQDQLSGGNDQIERDYQSFLGQLQGQEDALRSQQPLSQQKVEAGYAPAITAVKEQQASKVAGLDSSASTVEQQRQSQLQQARDLYRQIQQQNIAQLSGMGISSSSVAEALAENLGVETARRIASSSQSADDVIRQIDRERINVNEFAKQKLTDIETQKAAAIAEIQNQFVQGLNQINQARQIAANDKANRRQDLLSQAQQAAYQIEQNAKNFQQSLQMWQAQTQAKLSEASKIDFSGLDKAARYVGTLNESNLAIPQGLQDQINSFYPEGTGPYKTSTTNTKKKDDFIDQG